MVSNVSEFGGQLPALHWWMTLNAPPALTMWSHTMAHSQNDNGPVFIAVNPGSLLATKMVKEGFGVAGKDIRIGAVLVETIRSGKDDL